MEKKLIPIVDTYNCDEEYLYAKPYLFIKGYATAKNLNHTLKALPLAQMVHNGQYRKGTVKVNGKECRLPYVLHCLKVASTLIILQLPLQDEDLDVLLAAAVMHDAIEDGGEILPKNGEELVTDYGFPDRVLEVIRLLSKYSGASEFELNAYFNAIKRNKFALLVKLADRSHNVEDLYNMRMEKIHEYVRETRDYIYPLCTYGKAHYPELSNGITVLKSKIVSLTELTEALIEMYDDQEMPRRKQK